MSDTEPDPRLDPDRLRSDMLGLADSLMKQMDSLKLYLDAVHAYLTAVAHVRGWPAPPQPGGAPRRGDLQ
jgi:hypothetical protein